MAGSGRPAAREAGMLKTCPVAAPAAARGRCMAGSGRPTARELAGISYRSTACTRRTCSQSKNPGCCRIADTEPNNLRELRKSPSSSLLYPTSCHSNSAAGYPSGLAVLRQLPPASCFTEPQPRLRARHTHRMHRVPASIASAGGSKYSCNRIVKETSARSFIDCTTAVYRYRLRRIFKKGTPGTIVITRRLMLI